MRRLLPAALFGIGLTLVFAGVNAAMGFTLASLIASVAAITALLYAGAVWFGAPPAPRQAPDSTDPIVLFDQSLRVVTGARRGLPVGACFPEASRAEVEARCAAALAGHVSHFACLQDGAPLEFDAVPVRGADGSIQFGAVLAMSSAASVDRVAGV